MRRLAVGLLTGALLLGSALPAFADTQPTGGYASTGRDPQGFGGGPHCHILVAASDNAPFDIAVFPSHTAHLNAGSDIFVADPNCDGDPGL